jgi:hypothetical protein
VHSMEYKFYRRRFVLLLRLAHIAQALLPLMTPDFDRSYTSLLLGCTKLQNRATRADPATFQHGTSLVALSL